MIKTTIYFLVALVPAIFAGDSLHTGIFNDYFRKPVFLNRTNTIERSKASNNLNKITVSDVMLDSSFGNNGIVITDINSSEERASSVIALPDGKILAAGISRLEENHNFTLVKYNEDGSLDETFGQNGIVTTDIQAGDDYLYSAAVQADGKIITGGSTTQNENEDIVLVRYNSDGSLDNAFGEAGIVISDISQFSDRARTIRLQSDGKIIVSGTGYLNFSGIVLIRYNTDGSIDRSFGTNGILHTGGEVGIYSSVRTFTIQNDGRIIVVGWKVNVSNGNTALLRYNSDGSLDTSFGDNGIAVFDVLGLNDESSAIAIQDDGKIVLSGAVQDPVTGWNTLIGRINSDGTADESFGTNGFVVNAFSPTYDYSTSVCLQSGGKIISGGLIVEGESNGNFALQRYNTDGSLDQTFDEDGIIVTDISPGENDFLNDIALHTENKILAAGWRSINGNYDFVLARYTDDQGVIDQPHFKPAWSGSPYQAMNIYLESATLENQALESGDEIGIFDDSVCVGAVILTGEVIPYLEIKVSKDNPQTDDPDGFIDGNEIIYKLWKSASGKEITEVAANYDATSPSTTFSSLSTAFVNLEFSNPVINYFTVDLDAAPTMGGIVAGAGSFPEGSEVTVTTSANPSFRFDNWTENGTEVSTDSIYKFIITRDANLIANFSLMPLQAPFPLSPADHSTELEEALILEWSSVRFAETYSLSVAEDSLFTSTIDSKTALQDTSYQIPEGVLNSETTYYWRVASRNSDQESPWSDTFTFTTGIIVSVDNFNNVVNSFKLDQNYPNPFNPTTTIKYSIPENAFVKITIADILGRTLFEPVDEYQTAGRYNLDWNARELASGIYLYKLEARSQKGKVYSKTKKLMLLK